MSNSVIISLFPLKDEQVVLAIKVFVCSSSSSTSFHVFEVTRTLPKFSMYFFLPSSSFPSIEEVSGCVEFKINERPNRVCLWLNQYFLLPKDLQSDDEEVLTCAFMCIRDHTYLLFNVSPDGMICIRGDNIEVVGDIIQHLCLYLNMQHLSSTANFPNEFQQIQSLFKTMADYQYVKMKMEAEQAQTSEEILEKVVMAEDARIIQDLLRMKRNYMELLTLNREAINTHSIQANNHDNLIATYKLINNLIQKSAKLRCGQARGEVVSGCKKAIKDNDPVTFLKVVTRVYVS